MIASNFVGGLFIFCLMSGVIGQAQTTTPPKIKIETAVRAKSIVDLDGNEGRCTAAETSSCLLLKVSGIEPDSLVNTWIMKEKGGVYLTAGDKRFSISTIKTQSNSKYTLIEITVPKDVNEFALVIGDGPPTVFKVETAVLDKVKQADLLKGTL